jgi:aminoglycoside 6-adenylyltransferase
MIPTMNEADVLPWLTAWAAGQPDVSAMVLTSSRARPGAPVDALSDYDIVLAVPDAGRFAREDAWVHDFGPPMVRWGDQGQLLGQATCFLGVIYQNGVKIDYSVWPAVLLEHIAAEARLPDALDVGYRVLLDKTGLTAAWQPPSYRAHIPRPPGAAEYEALVQQFFWDATYAAKSLWRGDFMFARFSLEHDMKLVSLRRMLEWRLEVDHDWALKPGVLGRGLEKLLPPATWSELIATYAGAEVDDNWQSLYDSARLFRRVAREVGGALGFTYPQSVDDRVMDFVRAIQMEERTP